ncbi:hypothetical protein A3K55_00085 [Candidatus Shapirobacteria bacterium RBG_13_44_7]|uniref:Uncharacterized protein n=1 Tax=Candidatus Shapirobacteria bacterium RBG_13_44_7 TaxID=1802149 RepID=A0A1F7SEI6_9BACT|nr:MAG: hypothetical protein A3K55_00085 [Candidatus Shapirobacteria bacterium RBG_13_44_7]
MKGLLLFEKAENIGKKIDVEHGNESGEKANKEPEEKTRTVGDNFENKSKNLASFRHWLSIIEK